ncbi:aspartate/glutamate racemase family protein [Rhodopila sp.]|uniref:aspartate/glutamate racemase family protein n=1 Tax=Rhodopila sp. TaxID=2480087 RepID=UPI003D09AAF1
MNQTNDKVLGILGGMGPLASAQFMVRLTLLTQANRDQEHIPAVLWSDPRVPDRIAGRAGTGPDPLPWLLRGVDGLRQAGCGAIAIPCNTAHGWYEAMANVAGVPILHIVDAAAADLRRNGMTSGTIGVMATQTTLDMRLYQDRLGEQGWTCIQPDADRMQRLVEPATALVKANRVAEAYLPLLEVVNSLGARGASAVVLGCTEIPLGILAGPASALRVPVVDTIDALARAAIQWAQSGA